MCQIIDDSKSESINLSGETAGIHTWDMHLPITLLSPI